MKLKASSTTERSSNKETENLMSLQVLTPSKTNYSLSNSSQTISTQTANDFGFTTVTASMVIAATAVTAAAVDGGATSVTTV